MFGGNGQQHEKGRFNQHEVDELESQIPQYEPKPGDDERDRGYLAD